MVKSKKRWLITGAALTATAIAYRYFNLDARLTRFAIRTFREHTNYKRFLGNTNDPPMVIRRLCSTEEVVVDEIKGHWLNREKADNGVLVYLHGGGYTFGPLSGQWTYIAQMSKRTNKAALVINYRLAPEYPYPYGLDDAFNFISALQTRGELPKNYILVGDSAGGGLAVSVTIRLRDAQAPIPQKLLLLSPWLDVSMTNPDIPKTIRKETMLPMDAVHDAAIKYSNGHDMQEPLISPIYADVTGFPPVMIQVGTYEIFLWDNRKFAQRLREALVPVQFEEYEGMFHVFPMVSFLRKSRKALKSQVAFLTS